MAATKVRGPVAVISYNGAPACILYDCQGQKDVLKRYLDYCGVPEEDRGWFTLSWVYNHHSFSYVQSFERVDART